MSKRIDIRAERDKDHMSYLHALLFINLPKELHDWSTPVKPILDIRTISLEFVTAFCWEIGDYAKS